MSKVALLISAGAFALAGAAVAQNTIAPKAPAAGAPTAAAAASQSLAVQSGTQIQASTPTGSQQAADAACNADVQKFCSGKEASERQQCLIENKASLAAACRAALDGAVRN